MANRAPGTCPRRLARVVCVWAAAALLVSGTADAAGQKYAFLVGLNEYRFVRKGITELKFADKDATALAEAFRAMGYVVRSAVNRDAQRANVLLFLSDYAEKLTPEDTFVLFFAGHGVRGPNGRTYWLTWDADPGFLDGDGIRLEHLFDYVRDIRAGKKLVLLDHCFAGDAGAALRTPRDLDSTAPSASASDTPRSVGGETEIARGVLRVGEIKEAIQSRARGLIVLAAASDEAFESKQLGHGIFTAALLEALRSQKASRDDSLTAAELIEFVNTRVKDLARAFANADQHMNDIVEGADLGGWEIGKPPPGDAQTAQSKLGQYIDVLHRLDGRNWIKTPTKIRCRELLTDWAKTFEGGPALGATEGILLEKVRQHLDLEHCEEQCAKDLEELMQRLSP